MGNDRYQPRRLQPERDIAASHRMGWAGAFELRSSPPASVLRRWTTLAGRAHGRRLRCACTPEAARDRNPAVAL